MFEVDQHSGGSRWPLVRIGPGSETQVVVCGNQFLPLTVHWVGRSVPCCGPSCPLCCSLPARGLFYLACVSMSRLSILELGSMSASHFEQHAKLLHGGIRPGLVVRLLRRTSKAPIFSEVIEERSGVRCVPLIDLASRVCALYQLPCANPGENLDAYQERLRVITRRRLDLEVERMRAKLEGRAESR